MLCRQTNIVWVAFVCGMVLATHASVHFQAILHRAQSSTTQVAWQPTAPLGVFSRLDILLVAWGVQRMARSEARQLLLLTWPYFAVLAAFIYFLAMNGWAIVLGHAQYHSAARHWAHPLYLLGCLGGVSIVALLPTASGRSSMLDHLRNVWEFAASPFRAGGTQQHLLGGCRALLLLLPLLAAVLAGTRGASKHAFIVSDNRHFSFYVCSKFLCKYEWAPAVAAGFAAVGGGVALSQVLRPGEAVSRLHRAIGISTAKLTSCGESFAAVPGLPLWVQQAALSGHPALGRSHAILLGDMLRAAWSSGWLLTCFLTLVPAGLVEPRYFSVPAALWLMHARFSRRQLFLICILFIAVNFLTTIVFLHKPFANGESRFMW